jgi:hypothetical protein
VDSISIDKKHTPTSGAIASAIFGLLFIRIYLQQWWPAFGGTGYAKNVGGPQRWARNIIYLGVAPR